MTWVLSLSMLVALALIAGAVAQWRRGGRGKPALMVVLAFVMVGNVILMGLPVR
ncbi:MAG: hypothetical protein KGJ57_04180 [Sphingomonadales bacterium]|nr:hypothetical protein [Sphingomonadales bacterium]MDE2168611.1 hypothetical protein [Sphingomonadales bacterium]